MNYFYENKNNLDQSFVRTLHVICTEVYLKESCVSISKNTPYLDTFQEVNVSQIFSVIENKDIAC